MKVNGTHLEITLATANLLKDQPVSHPVHDVNWMIGAWHPDIIGCQEARLYHAALRGIPGYGAAWINTAALQENVTMWNQTTMRFVSIQTYKLTNPLPSNPTRYVTASHFVTRTDGVHVWYFNTHADHAIEIHGPGGTTGKPRTGPQVAEATKGFIRMAEIVQAQAKQAGSVVFWGGDLNVDENADNRYNWHGFPNYIFHQHNMISVFDELKVDLPGRVIDIIGSCNEDPGVKAVRVLRQEANLFTDHPVYRADYLIPRGASSGGADNSGTGSAPGSIPGGTTGGTVPPPKQDPPPAMPGDGDIFDWSAEVPIPYPDGPLDPVLRQPRSTWNHSVCCKKNG